ncbi:hypothetical protein HPB48_017236 [Haemaphysalis longicornis]|uniref:Cuticle protein n=1 Tax=Haemaphysalis longicornis TaxID=44386 RepID=A0A9J6H146_HAELO|nr:hypothetical protein HPB48_017236 [Haemaphysalis longicornis]
MRALRYNDRRRRLLLLPGDTGGSREAKAPQVNGNYDFGYEEKHTSGGSFRQETGDAYGNKVGSYGLHDADGRVRIVKYVADANGFRVIVNTNEPGTAPSAPAAASINVPQPPVVPAPAPVATVVSGGPVVPVATAPVPTVAVAPPPVAVQAAPVIKTVVPAAPVLQPAPVFSAPAPVVKTVVSSGPLVQAAPVLKTLLPAAPVVQPAPVFTAPGPIVKTVVSSGPFVQRAPIFSAPAPVATFSAAPAAVTTFKRFIPASVFGAGPVAAPLVQTYWPALRQRRYSTGFVPSLPYAASGPAFARRVVVRKTGAPRGYGAFGGGYGGAFKGGYGAGGYGGGVNFLKGAATSFASPAVLAAPGGYGAKLSAGAPSYSYGAGSVVPSTAFNAYASKPLDYYEHLANKLGATYLKRRR